MYSDGYIYYACDDDYYLVGIALSYCKNGQWESTVPICKNLKECTPHSERTNGNITIENTENGDIVVLTCHEGYEVAGWETTICEDRTWSTALGYCRSKIATHCDFEAADVCGWSTGDSNGNKWIRTNQIPAEPTNGQEMTNESDDFGMITIRSGPSNDPIMFASPVYPSSLSVDSCFKFKSYKYRNVSGRLYVHLKPESVSLNDFLNNER